MLSGRSLLLSPPSRANVVLRAPNCLPPRHTPSTLSFVVPVHFGYVKGRCWVACLVVSQKMVV